MPYPTSLDGYSLQNMFTGGSEGSWETGYFNPTLNSFLQPDQYNAQLQQAQQQFMQSPEGMAHLWNQLSGDANSKFDQFIAQTGIDAFSAANFAQQAGLMTPQQLASNGTFIAAQQAHARNQSDPSGLGVIGQELTNFGNQINEALPGEIAQTAGSSINQVLEATPSELSTGNRLDPGTYSITNASQGIADNLQNGQAVDPMGVIPSYFGTDPNATPMDYIGNPITATLGGDHLEAGRMAGKIATTMGIGAATGGGGTTSGDGQYGSYDPGGEDMFYEGGSPNFNESTGLYDWETGAGFDPGGEGISVGDGVTTGDVGNPGFDPGGGDITGIESAPGGGTGTTEQLPDINLNANPQPGAPGSIDLTGTQPPPAPTPTPINPLIPAVVTGATGAIVSNNIGGDNNPYPQNSTETPPPTDPGGGNGDGNNNQTPINIPGLGDFLNNIIPGLGNILGGNGNNGLLAALAFMEHDAMKKYRQDLLGVMDKTLDRADPAFAQRGQYQTQYQQMNQDPNWMQNDSVMRGLVDNSMRNVMARNASAGNLNSGGLLHELTRTGMEAGAPYALQRMQQVGQAGGLLQQPNNASGAAGQLGALSGMAGIGANGALGAGLMNLFGNNRPAPTSGGGGAPININVGGGAQ